MNLKDLIVKYMKNSNNEDSNNNNQKMQEKIPKSGDNRKQINEELSKLIYLLKIIMIQKINLVINKQMQKKILNHQNPTHEMQIIRIFKILFKGK